MARAIVTPSQRLTVLLKEPGEASPAADVRFCREDARVVVIVDNVRTIDVPWPAADAVAAGLKRLHKAYPECGLVILAGNRTALDIPYQRVEDVYAALLGSARIAETWQNAEKVANDQAILTRAGAPFGLTNDPVIRDEALKIARHDSRLRRFLPGGVKSKAVFGTPSVIISDRRTQRGSEAP